MGRHVPHDAGAVPVGENPRTRKRRVDRLLPRAAEISVRTLRRTLPAGATASGKAAYRRSVLARRHLLDGSNGAWAAHWRRCAYLLFGTRTWDGRNRVIRE